MNARHQFTAAPDGEWFCIHCDHERTAPMADCPSCEGFTESYQMPVQAAWERDIAPLPVVAAYIDRNRRIDALRVKREALSTDMRDPAARTGAILDALGLEEAPYYHVVRIAP